PILMTCQYLRMIFVLSPIPYCLLALLTVERAREKATCLPEPSSNACGPAPLSLFHRRRHGCGHHDRGDSRRQNARALRGHVALCLDGADRGDIGGAGDGLLRRRLDGGPLAQTRPALRLCPPGGDVPLRFRADRPAGGLPLPRLPARARLAAGFGLPVLC